MKLCLIDGSGFIFRAFHALPPLTSQDGIPVNAVYGFTRAIMAIKEDTTISHIAVIFDSSRISFRQNIYKNYKANRPEAPEDLIPQFALIREATKALNISSIEREGFEADDIIASYVKIAKEQGIQTIILSSDKDLMQLVDDSKNVYMYDPLKKKIIKESNILEKFGVLPNKVVQAQALIGDSSDNIPGVKGIGPKTAALLINQFGNIENLYNNIENIDRKSTKSSLIEFKELAFLSLKLVILKDDITNLPSINSLAKQPLQPTILLSFLNSLSFSSLATKIAKEYDVEDIPYKEKTNLNIHKENFNLPLKKKDIKRMFINNNNELEDMLKDFANIYELCFWLNINKNKEITNIEIYNPYSSICYSINIILPYGMLLDSNNITVPNLMTSLAKKISNPAIKKIFYNVKPFLHILGSYKIKMQSSEDIMLMEYLIHGATNPNTELAIISLMQRYFLENENISSDKIYDLYKILSHKLIEDGDKYLYEVFDKPFIDTLFELEKVGIKVDPTVLNKLSLQFSKTIGEVEELIFAISGNTFNVASPKQIGETLFEKLGYKGKKSKSGSWKTDSNILEEMEENGIEIASLILKWRQISKLQSTYTLPLVEKINPQSKRIHGTFLQTSTTTSRLSSVDPNLQNIPIKSTEGKLIRSAFVAKDNYKILSLDYSQIELRILASMANVKNLLEAFSNNEDIHTKTASEIFNIPLAEVNEKYRRNAKAINFGIIYGQTPFGLAKSLGISREEATHYISSYFVKYPEINNYMENTIEYAQKHGYVKTLYGRKCFIKDINSKVFMLKSFAQRTAINAPIQGTEADIVKKAMLNIQKAITTHNYQASVVLQIHDEIVIEVKEEKAEEYAIIFKNIMENTVNPLIKNGFNFNGILKVDYNIANNWMDSH